MKTGMLWFWNSGHMQYISFSAELWPLQGDHEIVSKKGYIGPDCNLRRVGNICINLVIV